MCLRLPEAGGRLLEGRGGIFGKSNFSTFFGFSGRTLSGPVRGLIWPVRACLGPDQACLRPDQACLRPDQA